MAFTVLADVNGKAKDKLIGGAILPIHHALTYSISLVIY